MNPIRVGLRSGLFPSGSPTKLLKLLMCPTCNELVTFRDSSWWWRPKQHLQASLTPRSHDVWGYAPTRRPHPVPEYSAFLKPPTVVELKSWHLDQNVPASVPVTAVSPSPEVFRCAIATLQTPTRSAPTHWPTHADRQKLGTQQHVFHPQTCGTEVSTGPGRVAHMFGFRPVSSGSNPNTSGFLGPLFFSFARKYLFVLVLSSVRAAAIKLRVAGTWRCLNATIGLHMQVDWESPGYCFERQVNLKRSNSVARQLNDYCHLWIKMNTHYCHNSRSGL
jgi:hypothetical protein